MIKGTTDPFVNGLKAIIKHEWSSQEEFCDGVTSTVNMSNVLRGKSGTSENMKKKLANRAGLSVKEIIKLGKESLVNKNKVRDNLTTIKIDDPEIQTSAELHGQVHTCTRTLNNLVEEYTNNLVETINKLSIQRDKLIAMLTEERKLMDALQESTRVVDKEMNITKCNALTTAWFAQFPGDSVLEHSFDVEFNVAAQVQECFENNKSMYRGVLDEKQKELFQIIAHPIRNESGLTAHVLLRVIKSSDIFEAFKEEGLALAPIKKGAK